MFSMSNRFLYDSMTTYLFGHEGIGIAFDPKMAIIYVRKWDYYVENAIGRCLRNVYKDVEYVLCV